MKKIVFVFLFLSGTSLGQSVIPFLDINYYFRSYSQNAFQLLTMQRIANYKAGDNVVAYVDFKGNLMVYDGYGAAEQATNIPGAHYQTSDKLMTWRIGSTLNLWDGGKKRTLTYNVGQFALRDDIVVFQDKRSNSINVYDYGKIYELFRSTSTVAMPTAIGENIFVYKENGDFYKIYWAGNTYDYEVWQGSIDFQAGTDIVVFNDPINGTFTAFDKGEYIDLENFHMNEYKAGRGFAVYLNRNDNLVMYQNGEKTILSNYVSDFWDVKDDIVIWAENGLTYAYVDGKKIEIARFIIKDYKLKNNTVAFRNLLGGVDACMNGKKRELTMQKDAPYYIYGNRVLIELFNRQHLICTEEKNIRN